MFSRGHPLQIYLRLLFCSEIKTTKVKRYFFCLLLFSVIFFSMALLIFVFSGVPYKILYYLVPLERKRGLTSNSCSQLSSELAEKLKSAPRSLCNCSHLNVCIAEAKNSESLVNSTCSLEASLRGGNQKVISYSLFKRNFKTFHWYLPGIYPNTRGKLTFYPDWVLRIYTNVAVDSEDDICPLVCYHPDVYFCDVRNLPQLGDVQKLKPMTWRFLPLGDPTVLRFISRDLDSRISNREREAVKQWEASNFSFHAIRDNPYHRSKIMGGLWGADNGKLGPTLAKNLQEKIMAVNPKKFKDDQQVAATIIYNAYKNWTMVHDSYYCKKFKDSVPFPVKRSSRTDFVGSRVWESWKLPRCPGSCRPAHGKNWTFC